MLAGTGLIPLEAGGAAAEVGDDKIKLEPGSVLAVPVVTGDIELTAVGTTTEVIGNRVFAFGHPFNSEGPISLPMGTGTVATVVANLQESFKLGFLAKTVGTLTTDQTVGVTGFVGDLPAMAPIDLTVVYTDKSVNRQYHFAAASHPKLTPQLVPGVIAAAVQGEKNLRMFPRWITTSSNLPMGIRFIWTMFRSTPASTSWGWIWRAHWAAYSNPFHYVGIKRITAKATVSPEARIGTIQAISLPRRQIRAGDTLKAFVSYEPFRAQPASFAVEMQLPRDLPNGQYQLSVGNWQHFFQEEQAAEPFRFDASNVDDMFKVLQTLSSLKRNAVYLRLLRQPDGIAVGRSALPRLPSSLRQVLTDSNRSDIVPFVSSATKIVPCDIVIDGAAQFVITIERNAKVGLPATQPAR